MVDYLKVYKELNEDEVISNIVSELGYAEKLGKVFEALGKSMKYSVMFLKNIAEMLDEVEKSLEKDSNEKVHLKIRSTMLIINVWKQLEDTAVQIDKDAISKQWDMD